MQDVIKERNPAECRKEVDDAAFKIFTIGKEKERQLPTS